MTKHKEKKEAGIWLIEIGAWRIGGSHVGRLLSGSCL